MKVNNLILTTGIEIPIPELQITLKQPSIREISLLNGQYFIALQLFSFDRQKLNIPKEIEASQWDVLQVMFKQKITGIDNIEVLILNFLQLFFKDKISFGPRSIYLSSGGEIKNLEPEQFEILHPIIKEIGGEWLINASDEKDNFKPKNELAAKIAEKMKKARARLKKIKDAELPNSGKSQEDFLTKMVKVVALSTANSLDDILDMTLYQLNLLFTTSMQKEGYELDVQSRLAGAKNDKPLIHWSIMSDKSDNGIGTI